MSRPEPLGASFRDPAGFLFERDGILYRQINQSYADHYARLNDTGLYEKLVRAGLLIPHVEVDAAGLARDGSGAFKVIRPERVPFISYPYEWSFGELKDAALATLSIQKRSLKAGLILKDASAYNIQFLRGRPMLIDTLSFETYRPGQSWDAYRQFCQHFLAPLALMAHTDVRLSQLMRSSIDGIPLDLAGRLLPMRTRLDFGLLTHIHLHAGVQARYAGVDARSRVSGRGIAKDALLALIGGLASTVQKLTWTPSATEWANYYEITNYSDRAFNHKRELVSRWIAAAAPGTVWDLGANTGEFSRLAAATGANTISFDIDPAAVEQNYQKVKAEGSANLLPLILDLTNPSPALGWAHMERDSLVQRGPADMILALALVHHLAISNNVPLAQVAQFFAALSRRLVVEFVPKEDSQVQKLLRGRRDIFDDYSTQGFETAFEPAFRIQEKVALADSQRTLYLMESR